MVILPKFSFGVGDRFGHQGKAQLAALIKAKSQGIEIVPVWNKSHREHTTIGTTPPDTRKEADEAVKACGWTDHYFVDADHINLNNVDGFIQCSDFFTIDVADYISTPCGDEELAKFVADNKKYAGTLEIPHIDKAFDVSEEIIESIGRKYLLAVKEAGKIYRHVKKTRGGDDDFVTEVSMDECDDPQTPIEMFFILSAIAAEKIPAQTIAPKFTGRFNKGVDYVGQVDQFAREFDEDVAVIAFAVQQFDLPDNLKLSVHSGSDKFSIYKPIKQTLKKYNAGVHVKTAGTTWLEELIGLAMAGGDGLAVAKDVYKQALARFDELCTPYATVIDIDKDKLPGVDVVDSWDGQAFAEALQHNQACSAYNLNFRQILHVGYKVAAQMDDRYLSALEKHEDIIAGNVTENIYDRHIVQIFGP